MDTARIRTYLDGRVLPQYLDARVRKEISYGFSRRSDEPWMRYFMAKSVKHLVNILVRVTRLQRQGTRNALNLRVHHYDLRPPNLPAALDGLRILHIGDTHADLLPAMTPRLVEKVRELRYDFCVHTGDFRDRTLPDWQAALQHTRALLEAVNTPMYCILGNHDLLAMVEPLEAAGARFLINEHIILEARGERFCLTGIDDPYHYKLNDLQRAHAGVPEDMFRILLAHEPHDWDTAETLGYALMLSGHTHGGQISLWHEKPTIRNANCLPHMLRGPWEQGALKGFTTWGVGCSGAPIRFGCPPEIALHTLRCGTQQEAG